MSPSPSGEAAAPLAPRMLTVVVVSTTERIPGFAICARCAARRQLAGCPSCGILVCGDCRDERECAVCHSERNLAAARSRRRARARELGRRAAVVALVAASGVTGMGAAFVPPGPMCADSVAPIAIELRLVGESAIAAPLSFETTPPAHQVRAIDSYEGLSFRCFQARSNLTCCVVDVP